MTRDRAFDPNEELGCSLSPSERVERVFQCIEEADLSMGDGQAAYKITDWEWNWLVDNEESEYPTFTPRMEAVMQKIEAKVFGEKLTEITGLNRELDGELRFKRK